MLEKNRAKLKKCVDMKEKRIYFCIPFMEVESVDGFFVYGPNQLKLNNYGRLLWHHSSGFMR